MIILAIETATKNCSVALFEGEKLIVCREENEGYSHAEKLHKFIEDIIKEKGYSYKDLSAVAFSSGPGSYTGLRIGLSAAKGLCFALGIPIISIGTLENMAHAAKEHLESFNDSTYADLDDFLYCPMIDARRMEVYTMLLDQKLNIIEDNTAVVVDKDEKWLNIFQKKNVIYFGDGALKCQRILDEFGGNILLESEPSFSTSRSMGNLIAKKWKQNDFEDTAYFEPNYLKAFMATTPKKLL